MQLVSLLQILSDGKFHSGQELGESLGVSRTSIWKYIQRVQNLGVTVHSVRGKGYRIKEPLELLSIEVIRSYMQERALSFFSELDVQLEVESTNTIVANKFASGVCLAERQTAGRGRRGKAWLSPFAKNISMSLLWRFPDPSVSLDGLSLCVGIVVARAIRKLGLDGVALKWPNDLYCGDHKFAGILLEIKGEISGPVQVVIGIGVNVSMTHEEGAEIDQAWTSLSKLVVADVSRNRLIAEILNELSLALPEYEVNGFPAFLDDWRVLDYLSGKEVELIMGKNTVSGIAKGVSKQGALLIETSSGLREYRGGEVSVRPRL